MSEFISELVHEFQLPLQNNILSFAVLLIIILLAPILLKRINFPGIVVLILMGVVIGPFGFNIIEDNSAIKLFSTIGILYIMFIAGLELDMNEFAKNKTKSLIYGSLAFLVPLVLTFPFVYLYFSDSLHGALLIACMTATHTLIAYPIISKMGLARERSVIIVVGGTVLTDTIVLMLLAVIMESLDGALTFTFWLKLITSFSIFLFIMFWGIPKLAKWFFSRLESEKTSHYIFVLSIMFVSSFLAELAGLEPVIGAFISGLALNRQIPHSSTLMNRIEFVGNAIFIPFFLISVGMMVDISVVMSGPETLILATILAATTFVGKWLAVLISQKIFGFRAAERELMFGLSVSHAAATLAIILVGYNAGIVDNNTLNATVILILVTCIASSFITQKAAKRIILEEPDEHVTASQLNKSTQQNILIPIANTRNTECLMDIAIILKDKKSSSPISLLSVVPSNTDAEPYILRIRKELESIVYYASAAEESVLVRAAISQSVSEGISRVSREIIANTIILGWPDKLGVIDKIIGDKVDSIVSNVEKRILISKTVTPLVNMKRVFLIAPEFAEHEGDFLGWLRDVGTIAGELSIPIYLFSNTNTYNATIAGAKKLSLTAKIERIDEVGYVQGNGPSRHIQESDLVVIVSSRRGYVSYNKNLPSLPGKLELLNNSKILIYPEQ